MDDVTNDAVADSFSVQPGTFNGRARGSRNVTARGLMTNENP